MRTPATTLLLALGLILAPFVASEEDPFKVAGGNIGRTAADDAPVDEEPEPLSEFGAITIPFTMPMDGVATVGLYSAQGQLVRILGQLLRLEAGDYQLRWDGLDLFGNLIPAGTSLELKAFVNEQVVARYEMAVGAPKVSPWRGRFPLPGGKEGAGGWLADHSAPRTVHAVGERVIVGAILAEHGNNCIGLDLEGHKLWGANLDGWAGTPFITGFGGRVIALNRFRNTIYEIDPTGETKRRVLNDKVPGPVVAMAMDADSIYCFTEQRLQSVNPFVPAFGRGAIDYANSQPQVLSTRAPTEFHISPQAAFGNTFTEAGNPQNGAKPIYHQGDGFIVLAFKSPQTFGSVCLPYLKSCGLVEIKVLTEGLEYDPAKHAPNRSSEDDLGLDVLDDFWHVVGEAIPDEGLNYIWAEDGKITTNAIQMRFRPKAGNKKGKRGKHGKMGDWIPRLPMARVMRERIAKVAVKPTVTVTGEHTAFKRRGAGGFEVTPKYPLSGLIPIHVNYDLGQERTFDALVFLNCVNTHLQIQVWRGTGAPDAAGDDHGWETISHLKGRFSKKLRWFTASRHGYERYAFLPERTTARWVRLRITGGYGRGKWGQFKDDAFIAECAEVSFVLVPDRPPVDSSPRHGLVMLDATSGKAGELRLSHEYRLQLIDTAPDGTLYGVADGRLVRCTIDRSTGALTQTVLGDHQFDDPKSMDVSADRIVVGDGRQQYLYVFDHQGSEQLKIGTGRPREVGPWNPSTIHKPSGVAIAANGDIWLAEETWAPKRVARFAADGTFLEEFIGPPQYGGGGWLDPSMETFHYRSMTWDIDLDAGTSRLAALPHRLWAPYRTSAHPASPSQSTNTFAYFNAGKPYRHQGRTYLARGDTIILLDEERKWRPCVVMGGAYNNPFLLGKPHWQMHWAKIDLLGKCFIWCDENGDAQFQVEEVQLFDQPKSADPERDDRASWLSQLTLGPGFQLWGKMFRVAPREITSAGVPIYRIEDFKEWKYTAPIYHKNYTTGGDKSAKPSYFGFKYVTEKGRLIQEGQPFIVEPDGQGFVGGPVATRPSDYVPPLPGEVMQVPFGISGGGMTDSEVGELVFKHNRDGRIYIWAADYGVAIGKVFTGLEGGWHDFAPERGFETSHRSFGWEGWFAHVIKADNGNWYAQGGKGMHAVSRLEGLDDFRILTKPVVAEKTLQKHNQRLRPALKALYYPRVVGPSDGYAFIHADKRFKQVFRVDGNLDEWGDKRLFPPLGADDDGQGIDGTWTDEGLVLAFNGRGRLGKTCDDWRQIHRGGFAIDLQFRTSGSKAKDLAPGDRRLVVGKCKGEWIAVLFQYRVEKPVADRHLAYESPLGRVLVHQARVLEPEQDYTFTINEASLGIDILDLDGDDLGSDSLLGGGIDPGDPGSAGGKTAAGKGDELPQWSAELLLPWATIGIAADARHRNLKGDIGFIDADEAGTAAGRREYLFNKSPNPLNDPALDARINPKTWRDLRFVTEIKVD